MTEAQMVDACRQANAHDFIVQLSQVHTRLLPVRTVCSGLPHASG
jgi:ABC-type multidrug transport system fused ATPase/permease subunit